ncbi:MAG: carbon storage regulator [Pseudomonas sp.]|uniref:carbon storage regulator n=1 Tax=Pseudomonas sp. TaxID=306 RepID=UPI003982CF11
MLILTRREAQSLRFTIKPEYAHQIDDLIKEGISVTVIEITKKGQARIGIQAPDCVLVLRDEIEDRSKFADCL